MSDSDLDKKIVYLAYRDIFKDKLAKLRKRNKVRNVVEKHKDHLHHKQLADSMDSEKTCRILGDLLAARYSNQSQQLRLLSQHSSLPESWETIQP